LNFEITAARRWRSFCSYSSRRHTDRILCLAAKSQTPHSGIKSRSFHDADAANAAAVVSGRKRRLGNKLARLAALHPRRGATLECWWVKKAAPQRHSDTID
jgi:hypothetical protein